MKIILVLMTVLQIKSFWGSFKGIFSTTKKDITNINKVTEELDSIAENKNLITGLMSVIFIIYALFLSIYHVLAGIYVNQLIFIVFSGIFIARSWKSVGEAIKWYDTRDNMLVQRTLFDRVISIVYLSYIGYLIYFIATTW